MEEVDNIIINSLKHLNCSIEEDIRSLKQFDNDMVIKALMSCIDVIHPGTGLPHSLPPSMSQRLKVAANIAEQIKEIGFRGDLGYQMILYSNEIEVRRLLMFLIERLPRESDKTVHSEDSSRMAILVKNVKSILSKSLNTAWVPSDVLRNGIRHSHGISIRLSYGNCYPLESISLHIPNTQNNYSEGLKQYCVHYVPDVAKQCSHKNLIPSLLFNSAKIEPVKDEHVQAVLNINKEHDKNWASETTNEIEPTKATTEQKPQSGNIPELIVNNIINLEAVKENIITLQNNLKALDIRRSKLSENLELKKNELNISLQNYNIKSKSHALLSNKENIQKLKSVVDNGSQKLVELTKQWYEVQDPLLQQYRSLMKTLNFNESEALEMQEKVQNAKLKCRKALEILKDKDQILAQISEQCNKLTNQANRSAYTERILEIIHNIEKQNKDIEKIIKDSEEVKKEINNLNGQLERSFALADEIIFRDAKQDETARKAYKLLANMHTEYEEVIQISSELGSIIRETRNIQEQVDTEESREIGARLERVMADLTQLRKEAALIEQNTNI